MKTAGDGMLVEFASAVDAVTCAVDVQGKMAERDRHVAPKILFRIGINVGDIIFDGDDIFGDGVNVAARVENECEPGGVYLSDEPSDRLEARRHSPSTTSASEHSKTSTGQSGCMQCETQQRRQLRAQIHLPKVKSHSRFPTNPA